MSAADEPGETSVATELRRKAEQRTALVGIVGLGYVGLPLELLAEIEP